MSPLIQRPIGATRLVVAFVVAALVLATVALFVQRAGTRTFTADFAATNSIYEGSEVRILGVPVGSVVALEPEGDVVRVTFEVDDDVRIPADVNAVVVSRAIVGDRFLQLAPAYTGGPTLKDGARIAKDRTEIPVELDDVYKAFNDLSLALGPTAAGEHGALSTLVSGASTLLDGQGQNVNDMITNVGRLSTTLGENSDELFSSVRQINQFVSMLRANDAVVREFNQNTAGLASVLADERGDLSATIEQLAAALIDVQGLLNENRTSLRTNVDNLLHVTQTLANRRTELGEAWTSAPTALVNVAMAYNGRFGTLDARTNLVAQILQSAGGDPLGLLSALGIDVSSLGGLLDGLGLQLLSRTMVSNVQPSGSVAEMLGVQP